MSWDWLVCAAVVGGTITGGIAIAYERTRVARSNLAAAKAAVPVARSIFWAAVGTLIKAAAGPAVVVAILATLYLIGRDHG